MMFYLCGCLKNYENVDRIKKASIWIRRTYAFQKKTKSKKYSHTIALPSTNFPSWIPMEDRAALDRKIESDYGFDSLYTWQRENINGPEYVLHDGPPYANGPAHIGHAINKIFKDIIIRHQLLNGRKIHFKPGWDCHGLPIELKALSVSENKNDRMAAVDVRKKARAYASSAIEEQKRTFKTWGLLADWEKECYRTYDKSYIQNQLKQFYSLYKKGFIYQDLKPVYWSPSSRTALAEAELEYNENHVSKAITVRFKVDVSTVPNELGILDGRNVYALIWTTTPWTLPANQAIAYNENMKYSVVNIEGSTDLYIIGDDLIADFETLSGKHVGVLLNIPSASTLNNLRYQHQFFSEKYCPFIPSHHVKSNKGTGLVHIAPAHGPDDFVLGLQYKLPMICVVDEAGCYTKDAGELQGVDINAGNELILNKIVSDVVHVEDFVHSYPYDWRTKQPVIIRSSKQWFINTDSLREKAINCLKAVNITPENHSKKLYSYLERRPFWCISRQRVWGVPIPVLYDSQSEEVIINEDLVEHYCTLIDLHGTDFWWNLSVEELLPSSLKLSNRDSLIKGNDILDIWFDSGISWSGVLDGMQIADLYAEGMDQSSGWFQSSLLLSVGLRDVAPYKNIFIHGFAVDENNRKMSKSLGNVIEPQDIIEGNSKWPAFGISVLRWWVACYAMQHHHHIPVTESVLVQSKENIQKLRAIFKFLLGVKTNVRGDLLKASSILDRYMLHQLFEFHEKIQLNYEKLELDKVCYDIIHFYSNEVSSVYLHMSKDRLYCDAPDSEYRLTCQKVCVHILEILLGFIAPIVPHLAEEVHSYIQTDKTPYYRKKRINPPASWKDSEAVRSFEKVIAIREAIILSQPKADGKLSHLDVKISASKNVVDVLEQFRPIELLDILQVASVTFCKDSQEEDFTVNTEKTTKEMCGRCRRYFCVDNKELCTRCELVVNAKIAS